MNLGRRPWIVLIGSTLLLALAFASLVWLSAMDHRGAFEAEMQRGLLAQARILAESLRRDWPDIGAARSVALLNQIDSGDTRVAVISPIGEPFLTPPDVDGDELLRSREAERALLAGWGTDTRVIGDPPKRHVMVAVRIGADRDSLGVVWLARPAESAGYRLPRGALIAAAVGIGAMLLFAWALLRLRRRVLERIVRAARRISAGDVPREAPIAEESEYGELATSLTDLGGRFRAQIETIDEQRGMLEALVNKLHEGVIVTRSNAKIALINPAAIHLLQLQAETPSALLGKPVETVIGLHAVQSLLLDPLGDGPDAGERQERVEMDPEAGGLCLHAWVTELAPNGDEPEGRVLVLTDITDLQRAIQIRTDFVANASHELRTPLAAIRGAIETLQAIDLREAAPTATPFVEAIDRHSARLEALVSDLLDLSKLESPAARFEPERISVPTFVEELRARFAQAIEAGEMRWRLTVESPPPTLVASPQLLRLALDNLIDNAIKYTEPGGEVSLHVDAVDGVARFRVSDTGIGIPREDQERVFERFYQVKRSRSGARRGTGLGLSIVRHSVAAMDGEVTLSSAPGQGTTVSLLIPLGTQTRHDRQTP